MGNKWELQGEKRRIITFCPCKHGAYEEITKEYEDDYLNYHSDISYEITCKECSDTYEYYKEHWITKDDYELIYAMELELQNYENELYQKFYRKYYFLVLKHLKTTKNLYDVLYKNRLFNVPGTIQTFYKNGIEHYIPSGHHAYYKLDDFIKFISLTLGFTNEENDLISDLANRKNDINNFIVEHSI